MTADAVTSLVERHEFTTGKFEVTYQDFNVVPMYSPDLVDRLSNGQVTMSDADPVACGITQVGELSKSEDMQRVVVDMVSRTQVGRMVRTMDAACNVGACVLVKPAGHPIPPLNNMVVLEPSITLPSDPMTSAGRPADINYSGGNWEVTVMADKYVPALLAKANGSADVIATNNVETVECEHCGNRHFAYEVCPCMAGEWWNHDLNGEAGDG